MLNIDAHKTIFIKILKEIYADPTLRIALGFKGGTAALLFYDLPRFSVDLDFDLLNSEQEELVFTKLKDILPQFGELKESSKKRFTLFFLLNYQKGERNLKVEISKRLSPATYEIKHYLGIPILVMKQEDMAASKLSALVSRSKFAARDLFDLWFFLKNNWQINEQIIKQQTSYSLSEALAKAEEIVKGIKKTQLLSGLGDLVDYKQRVWVREKLQDELLFLIRLYLSNLSFTKTSKSDTLK